NVILASADQVAIDAMSAKLMGFDPMSIKFIRLAHERGLGCGDPAQIEVVGEPALAEQNWHFEGPYKRLTFAARGQHALYWGPLRPVQRFLLQTVLAPWAYAASIVYHDWYWYPFVGKAAVDAAYQSEWGQLFRHYEQLEPDEQGWPSLSARPAGA
ncbi:MAG TPA: DUF362 domain-containing protein, partial [Phycisphaerae bacterium]|nr:DUF362 domain-containing protein [Phycisphaerae bacterium]